MSKTWSIEEIRFLREKVGCYKLSSIAIKMDRSYEAVRVKMNRLGITNTKIETGLITTGELAKILNVDRNTVKGWIFRHGLAYIRKVTRKSRSFYFIDPVDFWNWAELNKGKIQFSVICSQILLPEPEWVDTERQKEIEQKVTKKRSYKCWTTNEDRMLLEWRKQGLTYKEMGLRLGRSENSITRRYKRINSCMA